LKGRKYFWPHKFFPNYVGRKIKKNDIKDIIALMTKRNYQALSFSLSSLSGKSAIKQISDLSRVPTLIVRMAVTKSASF